ncbi:glycosyltransferase [Novosphingobium sp. MBES04]|uniref:glycosyltransferase n=1 Tax=Novosphingobium sp. MBES04 TaxID=1206458 RepID=UPI00072342F3|nr:glycosyltransferase [Novosphingobium sp. MBES04]GAM04442.1 group 1 glycosyl transferase [Novosphingobium sp. MBES04]
MTGYSVRTAIIHYWLVGMRGGERVLEHICDMFPEADIFTHVVDPAKLSDKLRARRIETTFIARLPGARTHYQKYLPLMPRALEALDLTDYDLVISSEAGPAKGVITRPDATHVTYCHSPMRYIWDQYHQYRSTGGLGARISMPLFAPALRTWDVASAARSDLIMANSAYIRARIGKFWGREARVVHPPVDTALFTPSATHDEEYLWVGQLVSYKRPDLAVDAFSASGRKLHVVGDGPMFEELRARAAPNVRFTRRLDFTALRAAYARARALVFTGEEDFGMIPVEVMASGRPVIAYGRGGALETVVEGETGLFFHENSAPALNAALTRFESWEADFVPEAAVRQARRFSPEVFRTRFLETVERAQALGHRPHPAAPQAISA